MKAEWIEWVKILEKNVQKTMNSRKHDWPNEEGVDENKAKINNGN